MLDLIEDLTNTASSMQQCFTGNGHEFDELIMRRWSAIRSEAIREGVFSVGDTQEDLFEKINNNLFKKVSSMFIGHQTLCQAPLPSNICHYHFFLNSALLIEHSDPALRPRANLSIKNK